MTDAPLLFFKALKLISNLKEKKVTQFKVIKDTFERGFGYWGHSENLFLAMLASENQEIRERAVAKIIAIRESLPEVKGKGKRGKNTRGKGESSRDEDDNHDDEIRIFQAPKPVYTAESFESMIDWDKEQICPPPYLQFHTNEEIRQFESMPLRIDVPSNTHNMWRDSFKSTRRSAPKQRPSRQEMD